MRRLEKELRKTISKYDTDIAACHHLERRSLDLRSHYDKAMAAALAANDEHAAGTARASMERTLADALGHKEMAKTLAAKVALYKATLAAVSARVASGRVDEALTVARRLEERIAKVRAAAKMQDAVVPSEREREARLRQLISEFTEECGSAQEAPLVAEAREATSARITQQCLDAIMAMPQIPVKVSCHAELFEAEATNSSEQFLERVLSTDLAWPAL